MIVTFSIYGALQVTHVRVLLFIDERVREINRNILYEEFHTGSALQSPDNTPATTTADFILKKAPPIVSALTRAGRSGGDGKGAALDEVCGKREFTTNLARLRIIGSHAL